MIRSRQFIVEIVTAGPMTAAELIALLKELKYVERLRIITKKEKPMVG